MMEPISLPRKPKIKAPKAKSTVDSLAESIQSASLREVLARNEYVIL
jgi:hypothetical protein